MTSSGIRILHLEDSADDAELIADLLAQQGIEGDFERVDTRTDFVAALEKGGFDLILSDFSLPGFDGLSGLELARTMRPETPFVFVSGTLGEEVAINALKSGATDYVLKYRLPRLVPAVRRALAEAEERRALQRAEAAMVQSEFKYRQLFECLSEAALLADATTGRVLDTNRQAETLLGCSRAQIVGSNIATILRTATLTEYRERLQDADPNAGRVVFSGEVVTKDRRVVSVAISAGPLILHGRRLILGLYRDITELKKAEMAIQKLTSEMEQRLQLHAAGLSQSRDQLEADLYDVVRDLEERLRALLESAERVLAQHVPHFDSQRDPVMVEIRAGVEEILQSLKRLPAYREPAKPEPAPESK